MDWISDDFIRQSVDYTELIHELKMAFRKKAIICPPKLAYDYKSSLSTKENTLLLMPAWDNEKYIGVKLITATPNNAQLDKPYLNGLFMLLDAEDGSPLVNMDARLITNMRTAATSALGSTYLAKKNASSVLILGNGNLSSHYVNAYASLPSVNTIYLWGRNFDKSRQVVNALGQIDRVAIEAIEDFSSVIKDVDIISGITSADKPLMGIEHMSSGQHFDLAGSFSPDMHEVSTDVVASCSVYTDNLDVTVEHAGELVSALNENKIQKTDIKGDLAAICEDDSHKRTSDEENTLFKATGMAIEDLVIARMIYTKYLLKNGK